MWPLATVLELPRNWVVSGQGTRSVDASATPGRGRSHWGDRVTPIHQPPRSQAQLTHLSLEGYCGAAGESLLLCVTCCPQTQLFPPATVDPASRPLRAPVPPQQDSPG